MSMLKKRGATIYAEIIGYGVAVMPSMTAPDAEANEQQPASKWHLTMPKYQQMILTTLTPMVHQHH